jgi:hypothetical protein
MGFRVWRYPCVLWVAIVFGSSAKADISKNQDEVLSRIGTALVIVTIEGGDLGRPFVEVADWVSQLDPRVFVEGNSYSENRLLPYIRSRGNQHWFSLLTSYPFYLHLMRMAVWVKISDQHTQRFYVVALNLPLTQLRDHLLLGRGEEVQSVEFLWHPMPKPGLELQDPFPPLLLEIPAEKIRQRILSEGHRIRVIDFLNQSSEKNSPCARHIRSLGWDLGA